jgi:hypothetical protein
MHLSLHEMNFKILDADVLATLLGLIRAEEDG